MRLLEVSYEFQYSTNVEWHRDSAFIVAGDDSQRALDAFREHVMAKTLEPDDPSEEQATITVIGYRLMSAEIREHSIEMISPDVLVDECVRTGIIELTDGEPEGHPPVDEFLPESPPV